MTAARLPCCSKGSSNSRSCGWHGPRSVNAQQTALETACTTALPEDQETRLLSSSPGKAVINCTGGCCCSVNT
jgi:hypothetical protein